MGGMENYLKMDIYPRGFTYSGTVWKFCGVRSLAIECICIYVLDFRFSIFVFAFLLIRIWASVLGLNFDDMPITGWCLRNKGWSVERGQCHWAAPGVWASRCSRGCATRKSEEYYALREIFFLFAKHIHDVLRSSSEVVVT
jgi:hypothetical protein